MGAVFPGLLLLKMPPPTPPVAKLTASLGIMIFADGLPPSEAGGYLIGRYLGLYRKEDCGISKRRCRRGAYETT